jgi:hypothetical protein
MMFDGLKLMRLKKFIGSSIRIDLSKVSSRCRCLYFIFLLGEIRGIK